MPMSDSELRTFGLEILEDVHDWIRAADAKAGLMLATAGALFAFVTTNLSTIVTSAGKLSAANDGLIALAIVAALLNLSAAVVSFFVLFPQLKALRGATSLMFFQHIAAMSDYRERFAQLKHTTSNQSTNTDVSLDPATDEIVAQIVSNSKVAQTKYQRVRLATYLLCLATITTAIFMVIHAFS